MNEQLEIDNLVLPDAVPAPVPVVVRREVDLGDGAGMEVFEAEGATKEAALEALADKMAEAKRNATLKIRQQENELKDLRTHGDDVLAANRAIVDFVQSHGDYENDSRNGELMRMKLRELGLAVTSENLVTAYTQLKDRGLLTLKSESSHVQHVQSEQIVPRVEAPRVRRSSGISTHSRFNAPTSAEPSEYEVSNMSQEQLRELANRQLSGEIKAPSWARGNR